MELGWVFMDHRLYRKGPDSFRADEVTSAKGRANNGGSVEVSIILNAVPDTSRLCVHLPAGRALSSFDKVVATHRSALLFRLEGSFKDVSWKNRAVDYFIYWACASGPKLSLLPRHYSTDKEIEAAEEGSWRKSEPFLVNMMNIGLFLPGDSGEFVVAELCVNLVKLEDDEDAPLEANLFRVRSHRSSSARSGKWEVKQTRAPDGNATFRDLCGWWDAHKVVPYASYLCWVDYSRGIIFCDVNQPNPELQYLKLPLDSITVGDPDYFNRGWPSASRAVCITKGGTMKFVDIVRSDGVFSGESMPGSSFSIKVFTLVHDNGYMEWRDDVTIEANALWDMDGYADQLPHIAPQFPLVSLDDPGIIYFVLKKRRSPVMAWVVTLNIYSKRVVSYKDIKGIPGVGAEMASFNIFCNAPFFPSELSKYMQNGA